MITFHTDERLALGEFGIQAQLVRPAGHSEEARAATAAEPEPTDEHGETMIYSTSARVRGPVEEAQRAAPPRALLVGRPGAGCRCRRAARTIGRSRDCDIVLDDAGDLAHGTRRSGPAAEGWTVADLGSTNGVRLNGRALARRAAAARWRPRRARLDGDRLRAWMTTLAPVSVALKFGFLAVLYLFVLWVARSARRDLRAATARSRPRRGRRRRADPGRRNGPALGLGAWAAPTSRTARRGWSSSARRATSPGMIYDLDGDLVLGRGDRAEIRLEDPFASARHARIYEQGNVVVIEDLGSTNGTYLNEEVLQSPRPLHPGDRVRIGDSEFAFEVD